VVPQLKTITLAAPWRASASNPRRIAMACARTMLELDVLLGDGAVVTLHRRHSAWRFPSSALPNSIRTSAYALRGQWPRPCGWKR